MEFDICSIIGRDYVKTWGSFVVNTEPLFSLVCNLQRFEHLISY